ncbi:unnamed protein product [Closterium sp. NIES-64]|nr:unnamed protein product [Closterium sp. NIES-64]
MASISAVSDASTTIVWFKHDLRLPLLLSSVSSLRSSLLSLGSDLIIARGDSSTAIAKLCQQVPSVRTVVAEEEVETCWKLPLEQVRSALIAQGQQEGKAKEEKRVSVETWRAALHDCQDPLALEFTTFKQQRGQPCPPLPPPSALPPLPAGIDSGALPSLEELLSLAGKEMDGTNTQESPSQLPQVDGEASALSLLSQYLQADLKGGRSGAGEAGIAGGNPVTASKPLSETIAELEVVPRASFHALFAPVLSLGLLSHRYVHDAARRSSGGGRGSTAAAAIDTVEAREWHTEMALRPHTAMPPPNPFSSSSSSSSSDSGTSFTTSSDYSSSELSDSDFSYSSLSSSTSSASSSSSASESEDESSSSFLAVLPSEEFDPTVGHWRWRGALIQYGSVGTEGPAILFVHGFGAFWQHFRDVMRPLAASGHRVWALTLPGFGRAEKPFWSYTQYVWRDCVADFIREVVGEPVVLGGNSIGGGWQRAASPVGDEGLNSHSHLSSLEGSILIPSYIGVTFENSQKSFPPVLSSQGAILISSLLGPPHSSLSPFLFSSIPPSLLPPSSQSGYTGPPKPVAWLLSRALFLYLRFNTGPILKRPILKSCYPVRPERADDWLLGEISRAATDPGAVEVVESAFYLPKPEPLNSLLIRYGGPVLVLQGSLDPLNDAVARANLITATCPGVALKLLKAGHCPHDEVPEQVAYHMEQWARATWCSVGEEEGDRPMGVRRAAAAARSPADALEILEEEAAVGVFGGMVRGGGDVGGKKVKKSSQKEEEAFAAAAAARFPANALEILEEAVVGVFGGLVGGVKGTGTKGNKDKRVREGKWSRGVKKQQQRRPVTCDAAPGNTPGGENGAAKANGGSEDGAGEIKDVRKGGAKENAAVANGQESRQEKRDDQVWGRRRLSDLEREILGVQRGDGVPASPKGGASASPRPSAPPPPSARPQLRRRDSNSNQKSILNELDEQEFGQLRAGMEEDPNSNQKSILDELDEQGFGQLSGGVEEWEAVKSAKRVGEWLEEKTIKKEGEDEMAGEC